MHKTLTACVLAAGLFFILCAELLYVAPARADTTGSWAGTVAYINTKHIGVKSVQETKDFLIPADFTNVRSKNGKPKLISDVKVGAYVTVKYLRSPLFGSTRVTEIDFGNGFSLPSSLNPISSIKPLPTPESSSRP
ncbi:MAG: hypothetical protein ABI282_03540 [Candidatus Baltobacteraceae bacterium]